MASPNLQDWFYVELTLKKIDDATTTTYKLSNRAIIDDSTQYYPLLRNISGVGARMGEVLPYATSGTISIDCSPGSFGYERRFVDLLERYTIIDQSVKIYAAQSQYDDLNVSGDFTLAATATVRDWSLDPRNGILNIVITGTHVKPRLLTKVINSVDFPTAPSQSLGKALPIVFGESQEVPAIRISEDNDSSAVFAYATTFGTTFPVGGIQEYYARDHRGEYQLVKSTTGVNDIVLGHNDAANDTGIVPAGDGYEYIYAFTTPSDAGYVVVGYYLGVRYTGAGTETSRFTISLYEASDSSGRDRVKLAEVKDQVSSVATITSIIGGWSRPVVLRANTTYYFGFQRNDGTHTLAENSAAANATVYLATPAGQENGTWIADSTGTRSAYGLYAAEFSDVTSSAADADGLGYAYFEVDQALLSWGSTALSKLDFIVSIDGLKDSSTGTITGVNNQQLTAAVDCVGLLEREWNGSTWAAGAFDFTDFSATHNTSVTIRGASNGRATYEQILADICRNSASRVTPINDASKQLAFWQWNSEQASSATIADEDCTILSVEQRGIETIVNRLTFYYDRRYRNLDFTTGSAQGDFRNYAGTLDWYAAKSYLTKWYAEESEDLYGKRPLASASFDWFADSTSAEFIARYLLGRNARPHYYVELELPFFQYRTLEPLQVVEILHPALPAFFGTSSNAKFPTVDGELVDLALGHYWKRAQRYRAQIESKELILSPGAVSRLRLGCRILNNFPKDVI